MGFIGTIIAIIIWRAVSDLQPVDYNKIRQIVKEEIKKQKKA